MSTELETKSAGVPAGATAQCMKCRQYWAYDHGLPYMVAGEVDRHCPCEDLRPIAEAGPAPTTAAPAEQGAPRERIRTAVLGTPDACEAAKRLADECVAEGHTETRRACSDCIASALYLLDEAHAQDRAAPAEQPGKAADPRPAQPQAPAEQWRSPECQYELPRLLEIASRHVPQEAEAFVRDLRAAAEHFREHPPAAPSEAPLAEEPRCQAVTRNGHRCGKEPHEEGDDEHEADNAAEGGSTLVWTEHYPHAEAPLDALREALGDATVYALRVGKALRDLIDVVSSDGDEPRRMRHAVSKAVTEGRAALSAPPPPPRELLGKEGGEALRLLHSAVEVVRFYSRPRPGSDGSLAKAWIDAHPTLPAPSSPEEQLSEGATTKKEG